MSIMTITLGFVPVASQGIASEPGVSFPAKILPLHMVLGLCHSSWRQSKANDTNVIWLA